MNKKNAPDQKTQSAEQSQADFNTDNSHKAQRNRLLSALKRDSITTIQARDDLNILSPAARVFELRKQGHKIIRTWAYQPDAFGRKHKIGCYTLMPGKAVQHDTA